MDQMVQEPELQRYPCWRCSWPVREGDLRGPYPRLGLRGLEGQYDFNGWVSRGQYDFVMRQEGRGRICRTRVRLVEGMPSSRRSQIRSRRSGGDTAEYISGRCGSIGILGLIRIGVLDDNMPYHYEVADRKTTQPGTANFLGPISQSSAYE